MSHLERTLQRLETLTRDERIILQDEDVGNLEVRLDSSLTQSYRLAWWDDDPSYDEGFEKVGTYIEAVKEVKMWFKTLEQVGSL